MTNYISLLKSEVPVIRTEVSWDLMFFNEIGLEMWPFLNGTPSKDASAFVVLARFKRQGS